MSKVLYVFALNEETGGHFNNKDVLFTGVGKVNATFNLTKRLLIDKPSLVVNFGTAGSKRYNKGSLVQCEDFRQRDMDCSIFGYNVGITPQDKNSMITIKSPIKLENVIEGGVLGTGDNFDSTLSTHSLNTVVDMEGYALSKVCYLLSIPFLCVKYITDGADGGAGDDWSQNVKKAGLEFFNLSNQIECLF